VNIVKHIQRYKKDGLVDTLSNSFSFDAYDPHLREHLVEIFNKHGVPIYSNYNKFKVNVAGTSSLPDSPLVTEEWVHKQNGSLVERLPSHLTQSFERCRTNLLSTSFVVR